ncbi:M48 family metallopeptidase [Nonomuraea soli]|uniref:Zn-dependent protease with chaperone function n=1 Tax=Nonomuraea soli TaxID=1032476 RepID=A0A7W0HVR2_9ACTN|nr:M48 family metallopeptidase [Nonomuraea soli]MBA2897322.1 Zn-dependent protease with chaperone function [Nonomuraea soli]
MSFGFARFASYAAALVVHLVTLALLGLGGWLLSLLNVVSVLLAVVPLGLAWVMLPRPARLPEGVVLARPKAPELYRLVDEVADALGAPRPHVIVIGEAVNASFGSYGWRRRRVLMIGYPHWLLLSPQERVAVLGHELGHSVNGDTRHGLVVGAALNALGEVRASARSGGDMDLDFSDVLVRAVTWFVRGFVGAFHRMLESVTNRASQTAEYRADELALRVAGSAAALSSMDKVMSAGPAAVSFMYGQAHVVSGDLWTVYRQYLDTLPEDELERRRHQARQEVARVDSTHPPTHQRHLRMAALPYAEPLVLAPPMAQIDRELEPAAGVIARTIADNARAALYS